MAARSEPPATLLPRGGELLGLGTCGAGRVGHVEHFERVEIAHRIRHQGGIHVILRSGIEADGALDPEHLPEQARDLEMRADHLADVSGIEGPGALDRKSAPPVHANLAAQNTGLQRLDIPELLAPPEPYDDI